MTISAAARRASALLALLAVLAPTVSASAACRTVDGAPRFVADGAVMHDRLTGLDWRRCAHGTTWDGGTCAGQRRFLGLDAAEAAARAEGEGWRVPDVKELYELFDGDCGTPPLDRAAFPDLVSGRDEEDVYWTTTPMGLAELWYCVDFAVGFADAHSRGISLAVRFVRTAE